jgi:hypothetical protein
MKHPYITTGLAIAAAAAGVGAAHHVAEHRALDGERQIEEAIEHGHSIGYDAASKIMTLTDCVTAPVIFEGNYYALTTDSEGNVAATELTQGIRKRAARFGSPIVSRSGVVEMNGVSDTPSVAATLADGSQLNIAVGHRQAVCHD